MTTFILNKRLVKSDSSLYLLGKFEFIQLDRK